MGETEQSWRKYRHISLGTFKSNDLMRSYVMDVLNSGRISYGKYSEQFEQKFAQIHDCKYAILSNSGTSSLMVALQAMKEHYGWKDGDEVVVPATTFIATPNIVVHNGLKPVFVDVNPLDYDLAANKIEKVITKRTRCILPVHLFGQPANMTLITEIAALHYLRILSDSCESMFAYHAERSVGRWGDAACFSTYVAHYLVTGVGGLATTNDPDLAGRMRSLVNHGLALEYLNPNENFAPQPMIGRRFIFSTIGHSMRITELEAAIGLAQLVDYKEITKTRNRNSSHLSAGLEKINERYGSKMQLPVKLIANRFAYMIYPIVLDPGTDKLPLMHYLNEKGIETRDMMPILCQPPYQYLDPKDFPVSKWIMESGFYIGCHQGLSPDDIDYVIAMFEDWFDAHR